MDEFATRVIDEVFGSSPDSRLLSYHYDVLPDEEIFTHEFTFKSETITRPDLQEITERIRGIDIDAPKRAEYMQFDTRFRITVVITT